MRKRAAMVWGGHDNQPIPIPALPLAPAPAPAPASDELEAWIRTKLGIPGWEMKRMPTSVPWVRVGIRRDRNSVLRPRLDWTILMAIGVGLLLCQFTTTAQKRGAGARVGTHPASWGFSIE